MNAGWVLKMAWRDGRTGYKRLLLYMSSIVVGIAAIVAVPSFGDNLASAVEGQAKELLGADLSLRSSVPFEGEREELLSKLGGSRSLQVSFSTMAYFPRQEATRLVQVRALSGDYPYYGRLETDPGDAAGSFQDGQFALVDETVMLQFGMEVGDSISLGSATFEVTGRLKQAAGESLVWSQLAPRVYIPASMVADTGLVRYGSRVRYTSYFKFSEGRSVEALIERFEEDFDRLGLRVDTVERRKQRLGRDLKNLDRFLTLVGFVALVLGGVGVATAIHLYIRQRFSTIAILRCVGASPRQTLAIYLVQTATMGILSVSAGTLLGLGVQRFLPIALSGLIPVEFVVSVSWPAVLQGAAVGLALTLLFAVIPLLPVRRISPLLALRSDVDSEGSQRDLLVWTGYTLLLAGLLVFSLMNTERWGVGLSFFGGLLAVFAVLYLLARGIVTVAKRNLLARWRYEYRQGLANLHRPHNQTTVLVLALGLGTFFLLTLYLIQASLVREVEMTAEGVRPNLILFDIQSDQRESLKELVLSRQLPVLQDVPIVTMRLASINGKTVEEIRSDPDRRRRDWALSREYRCTYRDHLVATEEIVQGSFAGEAVGDSVKVSVEQGIAEDLNLTLGDRLEFDVQGVPVETEVGSLREVDWRNFQPNFFVIFPTGVLEQAPQFHVLVTRTESTQASADLQREVVKRYPNISAIDLSLVIGTIDMILDKVVFAIRFMALFCIVTGFVVLVGAIVSGRYQRLRESALLRTIGASRRQIHRILFAEYLLLGLLAASMGVLLALGASWALVSFLFESVFIPSLPSILGVSVVVVVLTVVIGMFNSQSILDHPPMEVLRVEE